MWARITHAYIDCNFPATLCNIIRGHSHYTCLYRLQPLEAESLEMFIALALHMPI